MICMREFRVYGTTVYGALTGCNTKYVNSVTIQLGSVIIGTNGRWQEHYRDMIMIFD